MKNIKILLIEDNEGDIILTKEALEDAEINHELTTARNGKEGTDTLKKLVRENKNKLPDLILLDINLPFKNGIEVLTEIRSDESLTHLPVVMLTTSSSDEDILKSYQHHANSYITKPVDMDSFIEAFKNLKEFWFNLAKLPVHK